MDCSDRFSKEDTDGKKGKRFCEHCERVVSTRTYNRHKRMKTSHSQGKPTLLKVTGIIIGYLYKIASAILFRKGPKISPPYYFPQINQMDRTVSIQILATLSLISLTVNRQKPFAKLMSKV